MVSHLISQAEQFLDEELKFNSDEVFISRTDRKGIIQFGNETFLRIAGFSAEEAIGFPHNIVRHPSMPRSVFYLFWKKIFANEPVVAYVKNRTKLGQFYWVIATAIPIKDGILSIRIKPTTNNLKIVSFLYDQILTFEIKNEFSKNKEKCVDFLVDQIKSLGYESYEDFMCRSLFSEMRARDDNFQTHSKSFEKDRNRKERLLSIMVSAISKIDENFKNSGGLLGNHFDFVKNHYQASEIISAACRRIENLSVNMSISSHKLGKEGSSLSIISSHFQSGAAEIIKKIAHFQETFKQVSLKNQNITLLTLMMRVKSIMLVSFLLELRNKKNLLGQDTDELSILIKSLNQLNAEFNEKITDFINHLIMLLKASNQLKDLFMRLDLIRTGGKLEGSRTKEVFETFKPFIIEIEKFNKKIGTPIQTITTQLKNILKANELVRNDAIQLNFTISELQRSLAFLKKYTDEKTSIANEDTKQKSNFLGAG